MNRKPTALEMADDLENEWGLTAHADKLRELHEEVRQLIKEKEEAFQEGRSHGLYAARNALNDKFGL
jgi:hypothetical protein